MDYFMEFHWWYIVVGLFFCLILFGKVRGGVVTKRFTAKMKILDPRFAGCLPKATYSIFKEGSPDHIEIEIKKLAIPVGEELAFWLNGTMLAQVTVERNQKAEFDHWSNEGVHFPAIGAGDELVVKYENIDVLKGTFVSG